MKNTVVVACLALAAPLAFAQAKNFEGFSLGATLANTKTTPESSTASADGTTTSVALNAQYTFALGQQFVLGVGLDVGTGNNSAGTNSGRDLVTKNRYALEFTPGFAVSDTAMVYGKIASLSATGDATGYSENFTGLGYGLGIRGLVDKNMYWQVGYDSNQYFEKSGVKAKSTTLSAGVGYKF